MPANEDIQNNVVAAADAPVADAVIPDLAGDNTIIDKAIERIRKAESILIALSKDPSVDEISAALSFSMILDSLGKHATAIYSGTTPNALEFLRPDETFEKTTDSLQDFIVILNKSKADHLHYKIEGDFVKVYITPYKTKITESDIEFDHGDYNVDLVVAFDVESGDALDDALSNYGRIMHDATAINITTSAPGRFAEIEWSDPSASSVCEMVSVLAKKLGVTNYTQEIATALLTGIISATERFSNNRTTSVTMALAAELMTAGADQQLVSEHVLKSVEAPAKDAAAEVPAAETPAETPSETPAEESKTEAPASIENAQEALDAAKAAAEKAEAEAPKEEEEAPEPVDMFATAPEMPQPSIEAVPAAPAAPAAPVMPPAPELPAAPALPAAPTMPVPPVVSAPANPNETTPIAEDTTPTNGAEFVVSGNTDSPALNPSNIPMRATNPPMMAQAVEAMPQAVGVPAANATPMMSNNPAVNAAPAVPTSPMMNFPQIGSHEGAIQQNIAEPVAVPKDMGTLMAEALAEPQPVVLDSSNIKGPIASNDIDESPLAQVQQPMPANTAFTGQNPAMLAAPTVPQVPASNIGNIPTMYAAPQAAAAQPAQPFANQNSIQSAMNAIINPAQDPQTPAGAVAQLEQMVAAPAQTAGMPAQLANELTAPQVPQAPAAPTLPLPNLNAPAPTPAIDFSGMPPVAPVAPVAPTPIVVDPTQAPAAPAPEAPVAPAMPEAPAAPVIPAAPDAQAVPQAPQAPQAPAADAAAFRIPGM